MKIAVLKERRADERRVAASPETVRKLIGLGATVAVETGAGVASGMTDAAYAEAGAVIAPSARAAAEGAAVVLKVRAPLAAGEEGAAEDELAVIPSGAMLVGILNPYAAPQRIAAYAAAGITAFALELLPRITRAQTMDVLSSQANLAGYKAVLEAANLSKAFPLMMTAAGTVAPARVFVLGAGVAGLQAIATAKRLGAVVSATDVRPAAKEQVQSLGATFVMVENEESRQAETAGGYAREMSEDYKRQQAALVRETLRKQDIAITTALIPGRRAPVLITADMVAEMKPGAVIVDLAVDQGGNVEGSVPGEVVTTPNGVIIVGYRNMPARIASDASALYARNLLNFLTPLIDREKGALTIDLDDEIIAATCLTRDSDIVHPAFREAAAAAAAPAPPAPPPAPTPVPAAEAAQGGAVAAGGTEAVAQPAAKKAATRRAPRKTAPKATSAGTEGEAAAMPDQPDGGDGDNGAGGAKTGD